MFDKSQAKYFYDELSVLVSESGKTREILLKSFKLYKEIINYIIEKEHRIFSSYFAKVVFIIDNYQIPEEISSLLTKYRIFATSASRNKNYRVKEIYVDYGIVSLAKLINFFSEVEIPENISVHIRKFEDRELVKPFKQVNSETIEFIRCVVTARVKPKQENPELICNSEEFGNFKLQLNYPWQEIYNLVWKGAILHLINVKSTSSKDITIKTSYESLLVLEPNYLMDATELAECFDSSGTNPNLYFLKKFLNSSVSESMVAGNLLNSCFDELFHNPEVQFEDIYNKALMVKPLQIFLLALKNKYSVKDIHDKVESNFENLRQIVKNIEYEIITVEPSFISPKYGLQGRLDVLIEYFDNPARKDIIELKSGSPPKSSINLKTLDGKFIRSFVWPNHLAQTTCYNLMLDSTYIDRFGTSSILYSSTTDDPLRNAENIHQKKQEVLLARNKIISSEHQLKEGIYKLLGKINLEEFGSRPNYSNDAILKFSEKYKYADELNKEYFHSYLTFIFNEMASAKVGGNNDNSRGFSSLWLESIDEKQDNFSMLRDLKMNLEESDFENMHLKLESNEEELSLSSFRKGDMIILYPEDETATFNVWNNQILKSTIKEITEKSLTISLRNKLFDKRIFYKDKSWILEPDFIDSTNKKLLSSIYEFFAATLKKRQLILGILKPEFENNITINNAGLNENQTEIVKNAVSAKDYFLIQGPPGTGKTSYVLKSIVENIYNSTDENILVMAYTNRAVDEICSALKTIDGNFQFLRTGSKESSEHSDVLISSLSETVTTRELFIKVRDSRVIVSTVSSVLSNPEIMGLKEFHTAIVDEASQILEPQIVGILANVNRFILIGDEKQLPAVVTQDTIKLNVDKEILHNISLRNFGISLFERLLLCNKKNGWEQSFGMLKKQARMHFKIQEFPNKYFYNNQLEIFENNDWQITGNSVFSNYEDDRIFSSLAKNRIAFIESDKEICRKVNFSEAALAIDLTYKIKNIYGDNFSETTLGIICPFRAQCSEIFRQMDKELRKFVMVDTVERFQGSERDIIIISFAVNHEYQLRTMQSLTDFGEILVDRKLNVAMTRAKEYLVFIGNSEVLSHSTIYNNLIEFVKEKRAYIN
ncbi:MAG: AAA domain-containing protein [bacterium]